MLGQIGDAHLDGDVPAAGAELALEGVNRNEHPCVGGEFPEEPPLLFEDSDHGVGKSPHADGLADRILPREERLADRRANDADGTGPIGLLSREKSAVSQRTSGDQRVLIGGSRDEGEVHGFVAVGDAAAGVEDRCDGVSEL